MAGTAKQVLRMQLEKEVAEFRKMTKDIQTNHVARQRYLQQQNENSMVLSELERVDEDDARVFKLIGKILVRQDVVEARSNVSKRLEFLKTELERLDSQLKSLETKQKDKEQEVLRLQKKMQEQ